MKATICLPGYGTSRHRRESRTSTKDNNIHRFSPYGKRILNAAKLVYEDSIQNAVKEAICENEGNKNIAVAVDGTWQKRGYTSLNGVVTVTSIDTGDGDCKAFDAVKKKNIYGNEYPIEKLECIGHVMKRMGTRLRRLKAQLKGQILSDDKCLSGKNRLTEHEIDNLQSYYGSAIRRNRSSVQKCGKLSGPFFCISYQLMNILNMVFVPSGKIHGVDLKG
ncbi:uncharacterized protein TNCV_1509941 [Trichonephila clavipes]|nr:uncharacterized protein TNCV_1509941 [Trichonephila clavipes]